MVETITYQPASRYWAFQGIEFAEFALVTGLLLLLTVWWVRRRISSAARHYPGARYGRPLTRQGRTTDARKLTAPAWPRRLRQFDVAALSPLPFGGGAGLHR